MKVINNTTIEELIKIYTILDGWYMLSGVDSRNFK